MELEQLQILKMLEAGRISAEEAATLLAALEASGREAPAKRVAARPEAAKRQENPWARFWIYPLTAGAVVLLVGALLLGWISATDAARGWLVCGWLPLLLGLLVVLLAWWARNATWLHVRISEGGSRKVALSFPVPLALAAWGVRVAQPFVPQLRDTGVDDLIVALRDSTSEGEPFYIDVQDDEEGERVEVYIG
jgi:hypothetical protein